jgi:hypothetical protein
MKYGNHGPQKDSRAVNWADIGPGIEALEREYGGMVKLQIDREGCRGGTPALYVRIMAYSGWADFGERPIEVWSATWPTNAHRTMAGLLLRGIHSMDHMLSERRRVREEGLPF